MTNKLVPKFGLHHATASDLSCHASGPCRLERRNFDVAFRNAIRRNGLRDILCDVLNHIVVNLCRPVRAAAAKNGALRVFYKVAALRPEHGGGALFVLKHQALERPEKSGVVKVMNVTFDVRRRVKHGLLYLTLCRPPARGVLRFGTHRQPFLLGRLNVAPQDATARARLRAEDWIAYGIEFLDAFGDAEDRALLGSRDSESLADDRQTSQGSGDYQRAGLADKRNLRQSLDRIGIREDFSDLLRPRIIPLRILHRMLNDGLAHSFGFSGILKMSRPLLFVRAERLSKTFSDVVGKFRLDSEFGDFRNQSK